MSYQTLSWGRLAACAMLALGGASGTALLAQDLTAVTLQLDAGYSGANAGFIVAKEKGFFEEAGLDVSITQGKGSGSTAQIVGAKQADFGFSDGFVVANSVSQGVDIRMVGAIYRRNPTAIITIEGSGIESPKDLEGRTLALPTGVAAYQQFPAYTRNCGIDAEKVRNVNVDQVSEEAALLAGQVDSIAAFAQSSLPALELNTDKKLVTLWFADCGISTVGAGIIVHNDTIAERADLIAPFVEAAVKGFVYARANPDETVDIVMKHQPATDPAIVRREQELSWISWGTEASMGLPLGRMDEGDWKITVDIVNENTTGEQIETARVYTNDFAPTAEEYIPQKPE